MTDRKIWVDCDGVLCDFVGAYLNAVRHCSGRRFSRESITEYNISKFFTAAENAYAWDVLAHKDGLYDADILPGAREGLDRLRQLGQVGCVTAPDLRGYFFQQRWAWLEGMDFKNKDIVFAQDKSWVRGDILIDDKIENCLEWQARNDGEGLAILFDQPWNQSDDPRLVRAHGWEEAVKLVEAYLGALP